MRHDLGVIVGTLCQLLILYFVFRLSLSLSLYVHQMDMDVIQMFKMLESFLYIDMWCMICSMELLAVMKH